MDSDSPPRHPSYLPATRRTLSMHSKPAIITITSITSDRVPEDSIKSITMLGCEETIQWEFTDDGLQVAFPDSEPYDFAHVLKIDSAQ